MFFNIILQDDMKKIRQKLIVILLESELNKLKGKPIYHQPTNEGIVSNSDCAIVEGPNQLEVHIMPTDQHKLVNELCQYILNIQDAQLLE
jgi:hypothetical protein